MFIITNLFFTYLKILKCSKQIRSTKYTDPYTLWVPPRNFYTCYSVWKRKIDKGVAVSENNVCSYVSGKRGSWVKEICWYWQLLVRELRQYYWGTPKIPQRSSILWVFQLHYKPQSGKIKLCYCYCSWNDFIAFSSISICFYTDILEALEF